MIIGIKGIRSCANLYTIAPTIAIGVWVKGIGPVRGHLLAVYQAIAIAIEGLVGEGAGDYLASGKLNGGGPVGTSVGEPSLQTTLVISQPKGTVSVTW